METPLYALLTLADSAVVGADPTSAASALDGVTASGVTAAAAAALKSGMSVGAVGNISEVSVGGGGGGCVLLVVAPFYVLFLVNFRRTRCLFVADVRGVEVLLLLSLVFV